MDIFADVLQSLDTIKFPHVREFGSYTLTEPIGTVSHQGKVVRAENAIKKQYAIKFYRPKATATDALTKNVEDFYGEVNMTISLDHKNIVKVHTAGRSRWNKQRWSIKEGVDTTTLAKDELLFFVMDYIKGDDVSKIFLCQPEEKGGTSEALRKFEDMCQQVISALEYLHKSGVTHKDIKPDNIKYSEDDRNFILVDFGMARPSTYQPRGMTEVLTEYVDWPSITAQRDKGSPYREKAPRLNDLGQFSLVLVKLLPLFKSEYDNTRYEGISDCLTKATDVDLGKRYADASEFRQALCSYFITPHPWKFGLKLNEFLCSDGLGKFQFTRRLRIPVSGSILLPEAVWSIIDTPEFQRLRGTRQLGPTSFVFPGANHTRFEHSLGAYDLSLRYLESLVNLPHFREICEPVDKSIKYVALSALLHDIGHYPFSHWIEEIDKLPNGIHISKHEVRAKEMISAGKIAEMIEREWKVDAECVYRIIANLVDGSTTEREILIHSMIDSIIGVDRVDYLTRDSIHCGVDYGRGIDVDRLLGSLYVDPDSKKLCLTDKGLSCLQSIISCRNVMYKEVYWHKTVRACDAMFKRFFFEYVTAGIDDAGRIYDYLTSSDDYFIKSVYDKARKDPEYSGIAKLALPFALGGRSLYKPAFVYSTMTKTNENQGTQNFFDRVIRTNSYSTLVEWSGTLAGLLGNDMSPTDIILEKTPLKEQEAPKVGDFRIWNARKKRFESYPSELNALNQQLDTYVQAYVFCNPDHYDYIRQLAKGPGRGKSSELDLIFSHMDEIIRRNGQHTSSNVARHRGR
jgi:HD superfamily phosphohydrolase